MHRSFKYRLSPTPEQETQFGQFAGVCRLVYNAALMQRAVWWRHHLAATGHHISFAGQCRELTALRAEFDWIRDVPGTCTEHALRALDTAYRRFFSGLADYPQPRRKGVNEAFHFKGRETVVSRLNTKWSGVRVPKIGFVKFRNTRAIVGTIKNVIILQSSGHWYVSFACDIEADATASSSLGSVGIDRGIANTVTLSTGEHLHAPASLAAIERRQRSAKRALSRKKRGSRRYARQRRHVAAMAARCGRIRRDWAHRTTTEIARRFGTVVFEDLKIGNMTAGGRRKRGLNRSILNQGWGILETLLTYKLEERGGQLVKVNPAFTSQTCSACGTIDRGSRESQASFVCRHCGFALHADVNAAINILRGSSPSMRAEAREGPAYETRTINRTFGLGEAEIQ